jgi:putative thioredoxin
MSQSSHVIETTAEAFNADVLERSKSVPVVVDFWAAWCQPCRMLAPLLTKMAEEMAGQFVLVKADVDQMPQQAAAFRVEGIPAVFAVRDGNVVDSFTGLLTESQLREWLRGIMPSDAEILARDAAALEASDSAAAAEKYRKAIELDSQLYHAQIGLARVLAAADKPDEAMQVLERLEDRGFLEPAAQRIKAELQLRSGRVSTSELDELRKQVADNANDAAARLKLAEALLAAGQYAEGLPLCLDVVARERGPARDTARLAMLDAFRILGDEAELTREFRRKLASALY